MDRLGHLLARPVGLLLGGKPQRYLRMEAEGLKRRCEQQTAWPSPLPAAVPSEGQAVGSRG